MVTSIATPARIPASTVATPRIATVVAGETVEAEEEAVAVVEEEEEAGTTAAEVATSIGMAIAPGIASARD